MKDCSQADIETKIVTIGYGSSNLEIQVIYQKRKRLTITVFPDKTITAKAPIDQPFEKLHKKLEKKAPWMIRQLDYFEKFHPLPSKKNYLSGETHRYLGRQYRIKITKGMQKSVKLKGKFFCINVPNPNRIEEVKNCLYDWYKIQAKLLFKKRMETCRNLFKNYTIDKPIIRIRKMKNRWGSYSSNNTILLNTDLVKAPIHCIDYVIIHELCHFIHPKHNPAFYRLLSRILPDWQTRKARLEELNL